MEKKPKNKAEQYVAALKAADQLQPLATIAPGGLVCVTSVGGILIRTKNDSSVELTGVQAKKLLAFLQEMYTEAPSETEDNPVGH